jgi:molybdate transport system permease protein
MNIFGVMIDLQPIIITLKLASITTLILLLICTPLAWRLSRCNSWFKTPIEAIIAMPLVLPPTVLGFYLLLTLSPQSWFGQFWFWLTGSQLSFSFAGLVIGSVLYSLPFVMQPLQNTFEQLDNNLLEAASTLRASPWDQFKSIVVPLSKRGFVTAATLGFAHTVGEFGVVLMIGGNIPGKTQVVSMAIYDHVETLEYAQAHILSALLLAFSFITLLIVYYLNYKQNSLEQG